MLRAIFEKVTRALIKRHLSGKTIHLVRQGNHLAAMTTDAVTTDGEGRYFVTLKHAVPDDSRLGFRIETVRVEYPLIKWHKEWRSFVAQID